MSLWSAGQLMEKMQAISTDLERLTASHALAVQTFYTLKRDSEVELAKARLAADGTVQERADKAVLSAARDHDSTARKFWAAEASYESSKAALHTLESRLSACQSLLNTVRELRG